MIPPNTIQRMIDRFMCCMPFSVLFRRTDQRSRRGLIVAQNAPDPLLTCFPYKHKVTEDVALQNHFEMWWLEATRVP